MTENERNARLIEHFRQMPIEDWYEVYKKLHKRWCIAVSGALSSDRDRELRACECVSMTIGYSVDAVLIDFKLLFDMVRS